MPGKNEQGLVALYKAVSHLSVALDALSARVSRLEEELLGEQP